MAAFLWFPFKIGKTQTHMSASKPFWYPKSMGCGPRAQLVVDQAGPFVPEEKPGKKKVAASEDRRFHDFLHLAVIVKINGIPFWGRCTTHFRACFSGDWDVYWGYGILTHGHFPFWNLQKRQFQTNLLVRFALFSWKLTWPGGRR